MQEIMLYVHMQGTVKTDFGAVKDGDREQEAEVPL
jgi:hypothetical protein